ncbi:MAG: hypothetical protein ABSB79_16245 [Syntrophales bacterium]|jgi:hypothetical protein
MKKKTKHPKDMTDDEIISHVFHPNALKHLKEHLKKLSKKKGRGNR